MACFFNVRAILDAIGDDDFNQFIFLRWVETRNYQVLVGSSRQFLFGIQRLQGGQRHSLRRRGWWLLAVAPGQFQYGRYPNIAISGKMVTFHWNLEYPTLRQCASSFLGLRLLWMWLKLLQQCGTIIRNPVIICGIRSARSHRWCLFFFPNTLWWIVEVWKTGQKIIIDWQFIGIEGIKYLTYWVLWTPTILKAINQPDYLGGIGVFF